MRDRALAARDGLVDRGVAAVGLQHAEDRAARRARRRGARRGLGRRNGAWTGSRVERTAVAVVHVDRRRAPARVRRAAGRARPCRLLASPRRTARPRAAPADDHGDEDLRRRLLHVDAIEPSCSLRANAICSSASSPGGATSVHGTLRKRGVAGVEAAGSASVAASARRRCGGGGERPSRAPSRAALSGRARRTSQRARAARPIASTINPGRTAPRRSRKPTRQPTPARQRPPSRTAAAQ